MWSKLGTRVISALIGVVVVLALIFSNQLVFNIAICIVGFIALHELYTTFSQQKKWPLIVLYYGFALAIMSSLFIDMRLFQSANFSFVLVLYIMLLSFSAVIFSETISLNDILVSFFVLVYSIVFVYHLALIRAMENGVALIFVPLIGAWMTDTFAYFGGIMFGKHKLIPKISPKKTVEGAVSGVFGCVLCSLLFGYIVSLFGYQINYVLLGILGLMCSILSQFGDLTASLIKRHCGVKDFGNLIPGHGGILDRIDSLIFTAPLCYYFLNVFEVICK